jgi:diacylglycerol kinase (ATP)
VKSCFIYSRFTIHDLLCIIVSSLKSSGRVLVVVNLSAARARSAWPQVKDALARAGVAFDAYEPSAGAGETERRVRSALGEGCRTVAVVGGDGTLSEAARGFFESAEELKTGGGLPQPVARGAALAILPAGTGDDFARGLAGHRAPLDAWLGRLVAHCVRAKEESATTHAETEAARESATTREVDVLWAEVDARPRRFVCLNAATLGVGAEVATRVAAQGRALRRLPGEARFTLAAAGALAAWRNRAVRVTLDGVRVVECATNLIAVTNGAFAGGGMNFAPGALPDDGQLEVLAVCGLSRLRLVRELARVHRGGHLNNPNVTLARGTRVRVETIEAADALPVEADGDVRGHTPAEFRLIPHALRVVW